MRENTGRLKQSLNYRVKPYNTVTFAQQFYGKYNTPKGKPRTEVWDDYNPLEQNIKKLKGDLQNVIVKDLKESVLYSYEKLKEKRAKENK